MIYYKVGIQRNGRAMLLKEIDGLVYFPSTHTNWFRFDPFVTNFITYSQDFSILEAESDIYMFKTEVISWLKNKIIEEVLSEEV